MFLGIRDVYNITCGYYGPVVIDIRSSQEYMQSHIAKAVNFDMMMNCSPLLSPDALFEKIMLFVRTYSFSVIVFIADEATMECFKLIDMAFGDKSDSGKFKRNQYPFVCENFDTKYVICDYPCEILENLLLGACPPYESKEMTEAYFRNLRITHVVMVVTEVISFKMPDGIALFHLKLNDSDSVELPFDTIVKFIDNALDPSPDLPSKTSLFSCCVQRPSSPLSSVCASPARVLVHCMVGMSRSASCVIAYLMYKYRYTLRQCSGIVRVQREFVSLNAGFVRQLQMYEKKLGISNKSENEKGKAGSKDNSKIKDSYELSDGDKPFSLMDFTRIPLSEIPFLEKL